MVIFTYSRCQRNVANNCGINAKQMAQELAQLGLTGDKMSLRSKRKTVSVYSGTSDSSNATLETTFSEPALTGLSLGMRAQGLKRNFSFSKLKTEKREISR